MNDQTAQIATLEANYRHIMEAIGELKDKVAELPTHRDLVLFATKAELDTLKQQVEALNRSSPATIWVWVVRGASGVLSLYGVWALIEKMAGK